MAKDKPAALAISTTDGCIILHGPDMKKKSYSLKGESVNSIIKASSGNFIAATLSNGVFISRDMNNWKGKNYGLHVRKVWTVEEDKHLRSKLYAGTQYGHLFSSDDGGETWNEVTGLFNAPGRKNWGIDWQNGTTGLAVHTVRSDPFKRDRIFIVVTGNSVYRTDDAGKSWRRLRKGVTNFCPLAGKIDSSLGDEYQVTPEQHIKIIHSCTHKLAVSVSNENMLFQQNHCGVYMSRDSGESWQDISPNDKARHGFPIALTRRDKLFVIPSYRGRRCKRHLSCIIGRIKVFSTEDYGKTWLESSKGLPHKAHTCVLRDALAIDESEPAGIYFGTTTGEVFYSEDEGESWKLLLKDAGRIQGISVLQEL